MVHISIAALLNKISGSGDSAFKLSVYFDNLLVPLTFTVDYTRYRPSLLLLLLCTLRY